MSTVSANHFSAEVQQLVTVVRQLQPEKSTGLDESIDMLVQLKGSAAESSCGIEGRVRPEKAVIENGNFSRAFR